MESIPHTSLKNMIHYMYVHKIHILDGLELLYIKTLTLNVTLAFETI